MNNLSTYHDRSLTVLRKNFSTFSFQYCC